MPAGFRGRLESAVLGLWYGPRWRALPLLPLSALYGLALALRALPYQFGWRKPVRLPVPVVVIGNVTVGGTGKTPLVIHLARYLKAAGENPGILCRGYGGASMNWPRQVSPETDPREVGDEAVLLARRSDSPVAAGPDRARAGRLLLAQGCTVLLCDDGLQNQALARDVEIVVMDGERGLGNGFYLPAGPLRESAKRLRQVDAVVIQGEGSSVGIPAYSMKLLLADSAIAVSADRQRPLAEFSGQPVHALAGIGHPQRFFRALRQAGLQVVEHPFPDHYDYRLEHLRFAMEGILLMTEKDAVKCARLSLPNAWFVPVSTQLGSDLEEKVLAWVHQRREDLAMAKQ